LVPCWRPTALRLQEYGSGTGLTRDPPRQPRAAISLAQLWRQQHRIEKAHDLLAPIYDWFTEGFDTADLQEAKVLLAELN
jgi:predicted ATPase